MKKLFVFIFLLALMQITQAQKLIQSFDNAVGPVFLDPPVLNDNFFTNGPGSYCNLATDTAHVEGTGSMRIDYKVQAKDGWGGYVVRTTYKPGFTDSVVYMDLSGGTHLKLRYKVLSPALMTAAGTTSMEFKMAEIDEAGARDLWLHKIAIDFKDASADWLEVDIPLEMNTDNTKGFSLQFGDGDKIMQLNHIKGFEFALVYLTSGGDTAIVSSGSLLWDNLTLEGRRSVPVVFFNGKSLPSSLGTGWAWGQSQLSFETGLGPVPELNAIKWVQGNEWSNGWTGIGYTISPAMDMSWSWILDTLQFKMKAEAGVGLLRLQLEAGSAKRGWNFTPIDDNQWHTYKVALVDLVYPPGEDPTKNSAFDSSNVTALGFMAEATGIAGKVIYISEIWTGNPVIDVVPPKAVTGLGVAQQQYSNLVTWVDVPNEAKETYNVYYSEQPITDIATAKVLKLGVPENTIMVEHLLRTPLTDQQLTYYYAIVCKDDAGNYSAPAFLNTPTTNVGRGIPTISKTAPVNFTADGDLSDWANVPPIKISRDLGTGFDAPSGLHDGDADYSLTAYLAMDQDYLYFAADVTDDVYAWTLRHGDPWMNDAINLYIGLFDANTAPVFTSYKLGATPHYEIRFDEERVTTANCDSLLYPGPNYYFGQKALTPGYYFEAKISLDDLATKRNWGYSGEFPQRFHPVEGMQIPLDFSCNDRDNGADRELVFCYSPNNGDQSWNNPSLWTSTWIGEKMTVGVKDESNNVVAGFNLEQNYPNPFNPSTKITYSLQKPELVTLRVFDVLGREVATLVNQYEAAGAHTASFNASSLASGMYFYKLEAGSFQSIKKMMLLK